MVKLDNGRKFILLMIAVVTISIIIASQPKPSETTVAPATTTIAASATTPPTPVAPVTAVTTTAAPTVTPTDAAATAQATVPAAAPTSADTVAAAPVAPETASFEKLIVYQGNINNNHYQLSGLMPSGKCVNFDDYWAENCQAGQKCLQITYDISCSNQEQGWAGAYWLNPANNWGDRKGGYNLTGAKKLVFWARGKQGGEVIDSFKIGGITGAEHKFPDSDTASIGPVTLTKEWKQYSIDLTGKDLSNIVGGFAWVANTQSNTQAITFYLDNIYYE